MRKLLLFVLLTCGIASAQSGLRLAGQNGFTCVVTVSTATTVQAVGGNCVAPGANVRLYITDIEFGSSAASSTAADSFPTLKSGTGGTCGSNTAVVWESMVTANGEIQSHHLTPIQLPLNNELCWIMTTAGSKNLVISGYIAP